MIRLEEQLKQYRPWNEQEKEDKKELLRVLTQPGIFLRENRTAHMTASAWVVNPAGDKVLMVYHNIYHSWSWMGGHADGETDLLSVAVREVKEESGISHVRPLSNDIFSLEILTVDGHEKKGVYVPSHLHLNVTYLLEADEDDALSVKPDENSGVAWFSLDGAVAASTEPWFQERIYGKLNEKLLERRTSA
jgi:8-oxo-dGTP pyrophosphatase MutT (NUDIX family)